MTKRAKALLDSFEQLNEKEQQEFVATLLRRRVSVGEAPLSDEALIRLAEERFLELDRREADDEKPRARRGLAR